LIDTLMRTAITHAGAERGVLILPHGSEYWIEAEATIAGGTATVDLRHTRVAATDLPESVFRYALRTEECVLMHDASGQSAFSADEYIRAHQLRSVLCLPLLKQTRVVGVLYLENNLTRHAFTSARVAVLKVLASAAAISLENTRLYGELREREARVRRLVESNIIGICIWSRDGRIIEANEAFLRIIQYDHDDLASGCIRWTDLTPVGWRRLDAQAMAALEANGVFQPIEKEYVRRDGLRVPVLVGGALFEGSGDEGVAFVLDLSDQKRAERDLQRSEEFLAEGQRLSQTGSYSWRVSTDAITWSEQLYRIYEFEIGVPVTLDMVRARVHPDDVSLLDRMLDQARCGAADFEWQYRLMMPDGSIKYLHAVAHATRAYDGDLEYIAAVQDVTGRRLSEDALDKARAQLTYVARVTTLGVLTASIAHELNQPLSGIITNASTCLRMLAADPPDVAGARETARRTIRDGNRASEVITRLRALFLRKESTTEPLDLNEATREVIALSSSDFQRRRVIVRQELAHDLPAVNGDRVQLQQVILNLLLNAADALEGVDDRPRDVVVSTTRDGERIRVSVRDVGVGLSLENADQLFDPFYTTKAGGMGIGLSVSRSIVERHQGRLWGEMNDGPGATFTLSIPISPVSSTGTAKMTAV
jgi:PAS domain S-box-containing protein